MKRGKSANTVATTYLYQYSEERAKALGATFYQCWLDFRQAHPALFTPEAVCFF